MVGLEEAQVLILRAGSTKISKKRKVSSQIIANNDDAVNIDFSQQQQQKHDDIDSDNGCSPP